MASAQAAQPPGLFWLVAVIRLGLVRLVCGPLVTAGPLVTVVVSLAWFALVPARLVAAVALLPGRLVRIGLLPLVPCALVAIDIAAVVAFWLVTLSLVARGVVAIKFIAVWLTGN